MLASWMRGKHRVTIVFAGLLLIHAALLFFDYGRLLPHPRCRMK